MFYGSLILFLLMAWLAPWWSLMPAAFFLSALRDQVGREPFKVAWGAGLAWAAAAFFLDGRSSGLVSRRLAGLFGLPSIYLVYLLMGAIAFVSVFLSVQSGAAIRAWRRFD